MITEIIGKRVVVESIGKPAGVYLLSDFDDDELRDEKTLLISRILLSPGTKLDRKEISQIHNLISLINGELDKRVNKI